MTSSTESKTRGVKRQRGRTSGTMRAASTPYIFTEDNRAVVGNGAEGNCDAGLDERNPSAFGVLTPRRATGTHARRDPGPGADASVPAPAWIGTLAQASCHGVTGMIVRPDGDLRCALGALQDSLEENLAPLMASAQHRGRGLCGRSALEERSRAASRVPVCLSPI